MHQVQVNVVRVQRLQRRGDTLLDHVVPRIVELRGNPDLISGNTAVLDPLPNFVLIAVCECCVNVAVPSIEGCFYSTADFLLVAF